MEAAISIKCPACGHRLMDKKKGASGEVQMKCAKSKHIWDIELSKVKFKLIRGKLYRGDEESGI